MWPETGPLLAIAIVVAGVAMGLGGTWAVALAAAILAFAWRRSAPTPRRLAAGFLLLAAALQLRTALAERSGAGEQERELLARVAEVRGRAQRLTDRLQQAAARVAALPEAVPAVKALAEPARAPLFRALERTRRQSDPDIALAVHGVDWAAFAWTGRIVELLPFRVLIAGREDVFVLEGAVSTTLLASVAIKDAKAATVGYATAEITVATHRNIENEYLRDYDLLTADSPQVEVRYVDLRDRSPDEHSFPPLPSDTPSRSEELRSPRGSPIAALRVTPQPGQGALAEIREQHRRILSGGLVLVLAVWLVAAAPTPVRLAALATLSRAGLLALGLPWPDPQSRVLSPDVYSAATLPSPSLAPLSALAGSPLDLLLTALWLFVLAAILLWRAWERAPRASSPARAALSDLLAVPLLALTFLAIFQVVSRCSIDLEDIAILPKSALLLVMQAALLLILASGGALLCALFTLGGRWPAGPRSSLLRVLGWLALLATGFALWPRQRFGLPLLPALALFVGAALLAGTGARIRERLRQASLEIRAGYAILAVAALVALLFPSLIHFDEKVLRAAIESTHAPLVLRQPEWRDYVLRMTRGTIDDYGLLESEPSGPHPLEIEELAYAVWSATDLASFGFTSAVEIQDTNGAIVSRFALNLPSLSGSRRPLPRTTDWDLSRERSTVASAERPVLHAQRLLAYEGRVRGAVHVFVGDDYWNLPFLRGRDPYSILFRRAPDAGSRTRPLGLLVYDSTLANVFSSDERPPLLERDLVRRVRAAPAGVWTTLPVDGAQQHSFLFSDGAALYAVFYPRTDAGRYFADLVEAVLSLTLLALLVLVAVVAARTLLGRSELSIPSLVALVRRRFALRLFVAFMLVAMAPVLVLQTVVERFVIERLRREATAAALDLAGVAKKAVEDFALFQRDEAPGDKPVTDAALVWVASLIRNDLDVFERGRLMASSKRELYSSGLLPLRLSGDVHLTVGLEGQGSAIRTESIGGFTYNVVSVPLRFQSGAPRVLSIPLALRQAEVEAIVEDLRRSLRLASLVFLAAAAGLAVSMSRRISGPVRGLTEATQRLVAGDFESHVRATTHDELRDLVESFNRMARDLVQQRRDLERTNKLAAWAEMARQVAHEVKNPLTPIQLAAEHLRRVHADRGADFAATLESCTETILKQVRTLRGIVTEFSSFARPPATALERVELQPLVAEVASSYQDVLPEQVTLELDGQGGAPAVMGDRRLLERAVVNLVENALQAVGEAGTVRLRVRDEAAHATVEVEDSGPGVDPEVRARIFEPFFSTKATGSGLGLALVKKIAEDHGGGVSLDSAPGQPTRARLWLPLALEAGELVPHPRVELEAAPRLLEQVARQPDVGRLEDGDDR